MADEKEQPAPKKRAPRQKPAATPAEPAEPTSAESASAAAVGLHSRDPQIFHSRILKVE